MWVVIPRCFLRAGSGDAGERAEGHAQAATKKRRRKRKRVRRKGRSGDKPRGPGASAGAHSRPAQGYDEHRYGVARPPQPWCCVSPLASSSVST